MPRPGAGNVAGGVEVPVVQGAAGRACPAPYSEVCSTFRTRGRQGPARRADLGRISLVYFLVVDACVLALVSEHRPEAVDAGVVAGLGLFSVGQELYGHIADVDGRGGAHDGGGELVLGILAAVPDLGVNNRPLKQAALSLPAEHKLTLRRRD